MDVSHLWPFIVGSVVLTCGGAVAAGLASRKQKLPHWYGTALCASLALGWIALPPMLVSSLVLPKDRGLAFERFFSLRAAILVWLAALLLGHLQAVRRAPAELLASRGVAFLARKPGLSTVHMAAVGGVLPVLAGLLWRGDPRFLPNLWIGSAAVLAVSLVLGLLLLRPVRAWALILWAVYTAAFFSAASWASSEIVFLRDVWNAVRYVEELTRASARNGGASSRRIAEQAASAPERLPRHLGPWSTAGGPLRLETSYDWSSGSATARFRPVGRIRWLFELKYSDQSAAQDGESVAWTLGRARFEASKLVEAPPQFLGSFPRLLARNLGFVVQSFRGRSSTPWTGHLKTAVIDCGWRDANYDPVLADRQLALSADGRFLAYLSRSGADRTMVVLDRSAEAGTSAVTYLGLEKVGAVEACPSLSGDGRFLAFSSSASNLVPNDTNEVADVFLFDRLKGSTKRVSVDSLGRQASGPSTEPSISRDGRFIAFTSAAPNMDAGLSRSTNVFVHDEKNGTTELVSYRPDGSADERSFSPSISPDGRFIWHNALHGAIVFDRETGLPDGHVPSDWVQQKMSRVALSAGARFLAFITARSGADGKPVLCVKDRSSGTIEQRPLSAVVSWRAPSISDDGRFVAYQAVAEGTSPVGRPYDSVFLFDRSTRSSRLISEGAVGLPEPGMIPTLSGDGSTIAFLGSKGRIIVRSWR